MSNKINIDFDILDTKNPFFMSIVDQSNWGLIQNNASSIEITLPGDSKPCVNYFDKNSVNTYNGFNLGLVCASDCKEPDFVAIPDGIYCITVRSSCDKYSTSKKFLKTTTLELDLDKYIISKITCDKVPNKAIFDKITEIEFLLKAAKSHLRYDNANEANQLFTKACEMLEDIQNC